MSDPLNFPPITGLSNALFPAGAVPATSSLSFHEQLKVLVRRALEEDLGSGDHSTRSCIPADARGKAVLKIKEPGILAGMKVAQEIFSMQEAEAVFSSYMEDGIDMKVGDIAFEVEASVHTILTCERLVLNCMQRMSGIATLTKKYTQMLQGFHTKILDTRKTTPNFRLLEKEAVRIGGAINHRMGLYDMIMLKDNHIDFCGGIEQALDRAWNYSRSLEQPLAIEIETRNLTEVERVLAHGKADRIMLDNFSVEDLHQAIRLINRRVETEASGGITLQNLVVYAETGVDYLSVGALIHQARSLDLSLKAVIQA